VGKAKGSRSSVHEGYEVDEGIVAYNAMGVYTSNVLPFCFTGRLLTRGKETRKLLTQNPYVREVGNKVSQGTIDRFVRVVYNYNLSTNRTKLFKDASHRDGEHRSVVSVGDDDGELQRSILKELEPY
jgi:hypothetical protein